jgi:hypothetical protein
VHLSRRSAFALLTAASLTSLALPAGATTTGASAKGVATSTLTVLRLTLSGTTVAAGQIVAVAGNTTKPHLAKLVITPVDSSLTGPLGQQTVSAGGGTSTIPAVPKSVTLPAGVGKVVGPTFRASAVDGAAGVITSATLKALGKVTVLTVPLDLKAASLSDVSRVTGSGATAAKTLELGSLGLPSVQDLLAALGVDLGGLTQQLTQGKLTQLSKLVGGAHATLNGDVDDAQAVLTADGETAANTMAGALDELQNADDSASTANDAFDTALTTALAGLSAPVLTSLSLVGIDGTTTADDFVQLGAPALAVLSGATSAGTVTSLTNLAQAAVDAEGVVADVNALIDALQALIDAVIATVQNSDDPLAALGNIKVTTSAVAAKTPKAAADVKVGSVHVIGLVKAIPLSSLTKQLAVVTDKLSSVLSSVAGVTFTAPKIAVGKATRSTSRQGRTRFASASITGLTLTLPSAVLPRSVSVPFAKTISGTLTVGQLAETAQWTPARSTVSTPGSPGSPGTPGSPLPDTGGRMLLPALGLVVIAAALALRRRSDPSA